MVGGLKSMPERRPFLAGAIVVSLMGAAAVLAFALGVALVLGLGAEVAASGFGLRRVLPFSSTQVAVAVVPVVGLVMGCPPCCSGRAGGGFRGAAPLTGVRL